MSRQGRCPLLNAVALAVAHRSPSVPWPHSADARPAPRDHPSFVRIPPLFAAAFVASRASSSRLAIRRCGTHTFLRPPPLLPPRSNNPFFHTAQRLRRSQSRRIRRHTAVSRTAAAAAAAVAAAAVGGGGDCNYTCIVIAAAICNYTVITTPCLGLRVITQPYSLR